MIFSGSPFNINSVCEFQAIFSLAPLMMTLSCANTQRQQYMFTSMVFSVWLRQREKPTACFILILNLEH